MQHIVSVSSGIGSAFTWKLVCDKYGAENVTGLFADVNGEHPDNYRFLAEVTAKSVMVTWVSRLGDEVTERYAKGCRASVFLPRSEGAFVPGRSDEL